MIHPSTGKQKNTSLVLVILFSRTFLLVVVFFFTAWLLKTFGDPTPYDSARLWWPLGLILVNGFLIVFLFFALRREHLSLTSLLGFDRSRLGRDLLSVLWMLPVSLVLSVGATLFSGILLYGAEAPSHAMSLSALPVWAVLLSLVLHPLANAFIEQMTYNGYAFPRLEPLLRAKGWTISLVAFFLAFQHIAIPFALDGRFILWRFLSFLPLALFWVLVYARMRRLTSLVLVHWCMDVFGIVYSVWFLASMTP